jgi:hypothetical protein
VGLQNKYQAYISFSTGFIEKTQKLGIGLSTKTIEGFTKYDSS